MVKENIYNRQFYKLHDSWDERYFEVASWLWSSFRPERVIDFGCGNGFIISELKRRGASVIGLEGSINAMEYSPRNIRSDIQITDVTTQLTFGKYDLVISSEVAEHLPESDSNVFLDNLTSHAADIVFFTAAEPGQGGVDHINEQPHEYWIEKFNTRRFILLNNETQNVRKYLQTLWKPYDNCPQYFIWNSMVFKRGTKNDILLINRQLFSSRRSFALHTYLLRYLVHAHLKRFLRASAHVQIK